MPSLEDLKRKAQNAVYTATEKAQGAAAAAGEKAEALKEYAGGKAGALMDYAEEKAGALKGYAGDKAALVSEKRSLARSYQALGEWYAAQCGDEAPEAVADVVKAIRASQEKIAALRERGVSEED